MSFDLFLDESNFALLCQSLDYLKLMGDVGPNLQRLVTWVQRFQLNLSKETQPLLATDP